MRLKRCLFIASLVALFAVCFYIMNQHYDPLARYSYATEENRDVLLKYLEQEDIDYLVTQQIKPEEFLPFIEVKGFDIHNALWYSKAAQLQESNAEYIVNFMNKYKERLDYADLDTLLSAYSYNELTRFFDEGDSNIPNAKLISNPEINSLVIKNNETLFTYEPKDLVIITDIPHVSLFEDMHDIYVKECVAQPLEQLYASILSEFTDYENHLYIEKAYISYNGQMQLYENEKNADAEDSKLKETDLPGQSEFQLGYSVKFGVDEEIEEVEKLQEWLMENAHLYGFTVRYPKGKEKVTGHAYEPYTLRYIGVEEATRMYLEGLVLDKAG